MSARTPPAQLPPPAAPRVIEPLSHREECAWLLFVMLAPAIVVVGGAWVLVAAMLGGEP